VRCASTGRSSGPRVGVVGRYAPRDRGARVSAVREPRGAAPGTPRSPETACPTPGTRGQSTPPAVAPGSNPHSSRGALVGWVRSTRIYATLPVGGRRGRCAAPASHRSLFVAEAEHETIFECAPRRIRRITAPVLVGGHPRRLSAVPRAGPRPLECHRQKVVLDLRRLWVLEARDRSVSVLAPHGVLRSRLVGAERGALDLVRAVHCERSPTDGAVAAGEPGFSHRSAPVAVRCKAPRRTPPGNQEAADSAQRGEPNRSLHLTASTSVLFSSPVVSTGNWFPGGR
jgi:hypothetical protein